MISVVGARSQEGIRSVIRSILAPEDPRSGPMLPARVVIGDELLLSYTRFDHDADGL